MFVRAQPVGCDAAQATVEVDASGSELKLLGGGGPLAGTYQLTLYATPTMTFQCGNPRAPVTFAYPAGITVGGSDICPDLRIGESDSVLRDRWTCNLGGGATSSANFTLTAVD